MQGPINYKIDVADPFTSYARGLELGTAQRQMQAQQQQQQQMQAELETLSADPTPKNILKIITRYPDLAAKLTPTHQYQNEQAKQADLSQAYKVYHAVGQKRPDVAIKELELQATAKQNSGDTQGAEEARGMIALLRENPTEAYGRLGLTLAAADPERYGKLNDIQNKNELQPFLLSKTISEADKLSSEASTAATNALYAGQKARADVASSQSTVDLNAAKTGYYDSKTKLEKAEAALKGAANEQEKRKKEAEIGVLKFNLEKDKKDAVAATEGALASITGMAGTAKELESLLTEKGLSAAISNFTSFGPIAGNQNLPIPTLLNRSSLIAEKGKLLNNQAFLAQINKVKGLGNLSDGDRKALSSSMAALETRLEDDDYLKEVRNIRGILEKYQDSILTQNKDLLSDDAIRKFSFKTRAQETAEKAATEARAESKTKPLESSVRGSASAGTMKVVRGPDGKLQIVRDN